MTPKTDLSLSQYYKEKIHPLTYQDKFPKNIPIIHPSLKMDQKQKIQQVALPS